MTPGADLAPLLALLERHGTVAEADPHASEWVAEFRRFALAEPDCLHRRCRPGHFTASAWIVDPARTRTLLTHHRKLDRWLQLGGHVDGESDLLASALREAQEESGLTQLRAISSEILDLDRHWIPERRDEPAHWHYDVRFLLEADPAEPLVISAESKDLQWVELARLGDYSTEESLHRLARKSTAAVGRNGQR